MVKIHHTILLLSAILATINAQSEPIGTLKSVAELAFELKDINQRENNDSDIISQDIEQRCGKLIGAISASETESFNSMNQAKQQQKKLEIDLEQSKEYISNNNRQLMHDSEQIVDLQSKRCFENERFVNDLIDLKESLEKVDFLKANLKEFFKSKGVEFLETIKEVSKNTGNTDSLLEIEANYDLHSHPYEFNTAQRYADDKKMTLEEAMKISGKKGQKLEEDLEILLNKIEKDIEQAFQDVERREIQTANDFVLIEMDLQKQAAQFLDEIERKQLHIAKVKRDMESNAQLSDLNQKAMNNLKKAREAEEAYCRTKSDFSSFDERLRIHQKEAIEELLYYFKTAYPELSTFVISNE
ncbi:unnamed protein product [Blepharisma stoltei]|uniref:Uncharacterized protein n=1 Tax=Blepharisma stoltei TaxID=1481888 RepID=A0AAU9J8N1_9CILI|nr:unnamed protein product [Blepharisma stoltei]